jgi:hypothetical protein
MIGRLGRIEIPKVTDEIALKCPVEAVNFLDGVSR